MTFNGINCASPAMGLSTHHVSFFVIGAVSILLVAATSLYVRYFIELGNVIAGL